MVEQLPFGDRPRGSLLKLRLTGLMSAGSPVLHSDDAGSLSVRALSSQSDEGVVMRFNELRCRSVQYLFRQFLHVGRQHFDGGHWRVGLGGNASKDVRAGIV